MLSLGTLLLLAVLLTRRGCGSGQSGRGRGVVAGSGRRSTMMHVDAC